MTGPTQETHLPEANAELARVFEFLRAHEVAGRGQPGRRYFLSGAEGDQVEVPVGVHRALRQVVEAMREGLAVTITPQTPTLTTEQAADLLGVSRPTLVRLLETDRIPHERVGTHRRVLLRDLLEYRDERRSEQYAAVAATSLDLDDEQDLGSTLQELREARKTVAERHRRRTS